MQYKIPQNVQVEDKIVGPLTIKQLLILACGGSVDYVLYIFLANRYVMAGWLPPVILIALFTLAVTFLKVNGIGFGRWTLLMIEFLKKARKRTFMLGTQNWNHQLVTEMKKEDTGNKETDKRTRDIERKKNLESISKILDAKH